MPRGVFIRSLTLTLALGLLSASGAAQETNFVPATAALANLSGGLVCALGSSKSSGSTAKPATYVPPYYLTQGPNQQGVWTKVAPTTTAVTGLALGTDITSVKTTPDTSLLISSATIRFFVLDNPGSTDCADLSFPFTDTSTGDLKVTPYPYPQALFELTAWPSTETTTVSGKTVTTDINVLTIDTSNVDSFEHPIMMAVTKAGATLAELGNPVTSPVTARTTLITGPDDTGGAASPFVTWLKGQTGYANGPEDFAPLALSSASGSAERYPFATLESPKDYLFAACINDGTTHVPPTCQLNNAFLHWDAPLNSYFDAELASFFKSAYADPKTPLVVMGDAFGSIPQGPWTATSNTADCPVYMKPDGQSLELTMGTSKFVICNPVGQLVTMAGAPLGYDESKSRVQITQAQYNAYKDTYLGWNLGQPSTGFIGTVTAFVSEGGNYYAALDVLIDKGLPNLSYPIWTFGNLKYGLGLNVFETASQMVFANDGAFAAWTPQYVPAGDLQTVALSIERNMAAAFSRGVAACNNVSMAGTPPSVCSGMTKTAIISSEPGGDSASDAYWMNETNWYPAGGRQDYYAQYIHTARIDDSGAIVPGATCPAACANISMVPNHSIGTPANSLQGIPMGMGYAFGYDENPVYVTAPVLVPSKLDPIPTTWGTGLELTVTIGRSKPKSGP